MPVNLSALPVSVAVFGEALFDLIEQTDTTLSPHIGGSPFNVARSFCKQDLTTTYLSPISNDRYGQKIYEYAQQQNMLLPARNRSPFSTSLALVYMDENGQPDYRLYRKQVADLDIDAKTLLAIIPSDIKLFHTGSLALVPSMLDVLIPCFRQLKDRGVLISLDINMRKGVETDNNSYINAVRTLLPFADIVKVSDEDLCLMNIALPSLEGAKLILSKLKNGMVLLTKGGDGATLITDSILIDKPVFRPDTFVDAVGAGDTFFSAFLAQFLRNGASISTVDTKQLEDALCFGLMAATINVGKHGCQPPSQQDVKSALENLEP